MRCCLSVNLVMSITSNYSSRGENMRKIEHFLSYLIKLYALLLVLFSIVVLSFAMYAIVSSICSKLWRVVPIIFFLFFLGIASVLVSYNEFLSAFKKPRKKIVIQLTNYFSVIPFLYLMILSSYFYFFEKDIEALKMIIFGLIITVILLFNCLCYKKI